jgi:hypothetical protein
MFDWLIRRHFAKHVAPQMDRLRKESQLLIARVIMEELGFHKANDDAGKNAIAARAAARTNYLFGHEPSPQHASLDLVSEHQAAHDWLQFNPNKVLRELVIQSLRVAATIGHGAETGTLKPSAIRILEEFGKEFPHAPDPQSYLELFKAAASVVQSDKEVSKITHNKNGLFGSRITAISGKCGSYVVSTAKQGIFEGLSTWFYESAEPPFGKTEWIYKIIYSDNLTKSQRLALHNYIVEKIESLIDIDSEPLITGASALALMEGFNSYLNELVASGLVKDIFDSYSMTDYSK